MNSPSLDHHLHNRSISAQTRIDRVRHLITVAPAASISVLIGTALIAVWRYDITPHTPLWAWVGVMSFLATLRFVFAHRFAQRRMTTGMARQETLYAVITGATGLAWGLLAWLPATDPDQQILFITTVTLLLVLFVSGSTLMASRIAFLSLALALTIPLSLRLLSAENQFATLLGMGVVAICGMVLIAHRTHHQALAQALEEQNHSRALLRQQRAIFASAGEGIVFLKPAPEYTSECSRRFAEIFGYPLEEMQGMEPWRWHPNREQWKGLVTASVPSIAAGKPFQREIQLMRANGSLFWAEVTGMALDPENLSAGTVWIVSDITEKRAAKEALRLSEQRFRDLVKLSSEIYWEQDAQLRFTKFDGPDAVLKRLPLYQFIGRTRWNTEVISGVPRLQWEAHIATLERHEPFREFIYQLELGDGQTCWMSVSGNPLFDPNGNFTGYHGTTSDVTTRIQTEKRYRYLAYHDPLTQLPNRRLLHDRLEQAIRNAQRKSLHLAILAIDLDGFKLVNDHHGHAAGDKVLECLASRLTAIVRESDTVARYGGDEFVVLLSEIGGVDEALAIAEELHGVISEAIPHEETQLQVGSSIGLTLYPNHGENADALLAHADAAMYRAKNDGGQRTWIFDPEA